MRNKIIAGYSVLSTKKMYENCYTKYITILSTEFIDSAICVKYTFGVYNPLLSSIGLIQKVIISSSYFLFNILPYLEFLNALAFKTLIVPEYVITDSDN